MKRLCLFAGLAAVAALWVAAALSAAPVFPAESLPETWVSGERPDHWEPGHLYLVECWASWCGPCLRAMSHLEALWQEVKDERIHVIGVNVGEQRTSEDIQAFLAKRPVPPTYSICRDPQNLVRKRVEFRGIPFAFAVREGEVVWEGHPSTLTADKLRALRDGRDPNVVPPPKPKVASAAVDMVAMLEERADEAAARGDWTAALDAQRQALLRHPLQKRLDVPYVPEISAGNPPESLPPPEATTDSGEAAPYAALLGEPLPADNCLTIVSIYRYPWWTRGRPTLQSGKDIPGVPEAAVCPVAHRTLFVADAAAKEELEPFLAKIPDAPAFRYAPSPDLELFGYNDRLNYPFFAVFQGGKLLYKGSFETFPRALRTAWATPDEARAAVVLEHETRDRQFAMFRALHTTATPEEARDLRDKLAAENLSPDVGSCFLPLLFAEAYTANDLAAGKKLFRELLDRFGDHDAPLGMLDKMATSWPDLGDSLAAERSRLWERIAEVNSRLDPVYDEAAFLQAANYARRANFYDREQHLLRRAIEVSPSGRRWRMLFSGRRALPVS